MRFETAPRQHPRCQAREDSVANVGRDGTGRQGPVRNGREPADSFCRFSLRQSIHRLQAAQAGVARPIMPALPVQRAPALPCPGRLLLLPSQLRDACLAMPRFLVCGQPSLPPRWARRRRAPRRTPNRPQRRLQQQAGTRDCGHTGPRARRRPAMVGCKGPPTRHAHAARQYKDGRAASSRGAPGRHLAGP